MHKIASYYGAQVFRATLHRPVRIHSPHYRSSCVGRCHYDFMPQAVSFELHSFTSRIMSPHKVWSSSLYDTSSLQAHRSFIHVDIVRGKTCSLETCFTGRSSSYSDSYIVIASSRRTEAIGYDGKSHLHALSSYPKHDHTALIAARQGFTALQDCLRTIAPFPLIMHDTSVEPEMPPFDSRGHIRRTGGLGYMFLRSPCLRRVKIRTYQRMV
ncbi:hypothetical protein IW261DRAFT_1032686 [Armillaria novae-zelandiae]|uniref:Uncharacterized protein n=1 Tax=Armillaria novae-zelandiae TaxID=153914 RepID=A0AA39TDW3_9AGAR|nr:hypothetical protein IW261DRAFT_1032686 [Armillaria novae-zelandiae]